MFGLRNTERARGNETRILVESRPHYEREQSSESLLGESKGTVLKLSQIKAAVGWREQ